jgi:hypothetical protein
MHEPAAGFYAAALLLIAGCWMLALVLLSE